MKKTLTSVTHAQLDGFDFELMKFGYEIISGQVCRADVFCKNFNDFMTIAANAFDSNACEYDFKFLGLKVIEVKKLRSKSKIIVKEILQTSATYVLIDENVIYRVMVNIQE